MRRPAVAELSARDRRVERSRRTLEFTIDALIRPGSWAARLAYELGLQGRVHARMQAALRDLIEQKPSAPP